MQAARTKKALPDQSATTGRPKPDFGVAAADMANLDGPNRCRSGMLMDCFGINERSSSATIQARPDPRLRRADQVPISNDTSRDGPSHMRV